MKLFWTAVIAGILVITAHVFTLDYKKDIAYQMAPPEPATRAISDEEAIAYLRDGTYSNLYDETPSPRSIELAKASLRYGKSYEFYEKNVKPIEEKVEVRANAAFGVAYLFVALLLIVSARRWIRSSGLARLAQSLKNALSSAINLAGRPFQGFIAKTQVRSAEAEFNSLKNLFDNGLISEADFNLKKKELQEKIQKNL